MGFRAFRSASSFVSWDADASRKPARQLPPPLANILKQDSEQLTIIEMIKRITFLICFFISICANAQTGCENQRIIVRGNPQNLPKPSYILVIDTLKITPDSLLVTKLNPKWIKKIEVIKDIKYINLYGNKDGLIFIYIKKKYRKDALTLLDKLSNK